MKMSKRERLQLRTQIRAAVDYAYARWADCCQNSCDRPGHYADCVTEGDMIKRARKALRSLSRQETQE